MHLLSFVPPPGLAHLPTQFAARSSHPAAVTASAGELRSTPMPMRVIAKKRCRAMFESPEKGERATLNPNLSTRLKPTFFRSGPWAAGWLLLVEEGERRCLAVLRGRKTDRGWLYPLGIALRSDTVAT